jgi:hypothetical protein
MPSERSSQAAARAAEEAIYAPPRLRQQGDPGQARECFAGVMVPLAQLHACAAAFGLRARHRDQSASAPPGRPGPRSAYAAWHRRRSALGHHQHAIGEEQRLGHVVRDHDRGEASRSCSARIALPSWSRVTGSSAPNGSSISISRGSSRQRARHADALALTARQCASGMRGDLARKIDQVEQIGDAMPGLLLAFQAQADRDILGDGHVREQADILEDIADPPRSTCAPRAVHVLPSIAMLPASGAIRRLTVLSRVDLPDPELPTSATKLPPGDLERHGRSATVPP